MKKHHVEMTEAEMNEWKAVQAKAEKLKARQEAEQQALKKKQEAEAKLQADRAALEPKFRKALAVANEEIEKHIASARKELEKAIAVSEKHGVPFCSTIIDLEGDTARSYIPETFAKTWGKLDISEMDDIDEDLTYLDTAESGWEHWSTSSLRC